MLRKVLFASFTLAVCVGLGLAGEYRVSISKVDGKNVTFTVVKKGEKGEEKTLPVSDKVKVSKGKMNAETKKMEATDAIEGGLTSATFTKIGEKGLQATIITDDEDKKITEIIIGGKGKKKNQ